MNKFYKLENYTHRLYPLSIVFFIDIFLIFGATFLETNGTTPYTNVENLMGNKIWSIFLFFVFIVNIFIINFSRVYGKKLMETKYVSPQLIVFMTGVCGLFLSIFILIITNNVSCGTHQFCNVIDSQSGDKYFDNLIIYLKNLNSYYSTNTTKFFLEIFLVTPLISFIEFLQVYLEVLIIYYLNPIYFLASDTIYFTLTNVVKYINGEIKDPHNTNMIRFSFFSSMIMFP